MDFFDKQYATRGKQKVKQIDIKKSYFYYKHKKIAKKGYIILSQQSTIFLILDYNIYIYISTIIHYI